MDKANKRKTVINETGFPSSILLDSILDNLDLFIRKDLFNILNTGFKGFKYGFRIRFIHSLLVSIISWKFSLKKVINKSVIHGKTLFKFAALFKFILLILKKLSIPNKSNKTNNKVFTNGNLYDTNLNYFISGAISGYLTIDSSQIPTQMTLFLFSRVLMMYSKILSRTYSLPSSARIHYVDSIIWKSIVVFTWGSIMYFWKIGKVHDYYSILQSMDFIYSDKSGGGFNGKKWNDVLNFVSNGFLF